MTLFVEQNALGTQFGIMDILIPALGGGGAVVPGNGTDQVFGMDLSILANSLTFYLLMMYVDMSNSIRSLFIRTNLSSYF